MSVCCKIVAAFILFYCTWNHILSCWMLLYARKPRLWRPGEPQRLETSLKRSQLHSLTSRPDNLYQPGMIDLMDHIDVTLPGYFWHRWPSSVGKLSWDNITTWVNSALHPSRVAKLSTNFGYFFNPENDFSGFLDPKKPKEDINFVTARQIFKKSSFSHLLSGINTPVKWKQH